MLNKKSLVDQIYDTLLLRIRNLEYKPGTQFILDELKKEFLVSSAPIREALQRLVKDNIVILIPRVGYNVAPMTKKDIENVFEARKLVEGFCLQIAINNGKKERLISIHTRMLELQQRLKVEIPPPVDLVNQCIDMDDFLHKDILVQTCSNMIILKFYETLNNFSSIIRHYSFRVAKDLTQHISIVEAMLESDFPKTERLLKAHLDDAMAETIEWLSAATQDNQPKS